MIDTSILRPRFQNTYLFLIAFGVVWGELCILMDYIFVPILLGGDEEVGVRQVGTEQGRMVVEVVIVGYDGWRQMWRVL